MTGPGFVTLSYGTVESRIDPYEIGIIAVHMPQRYLIHSRPSHLKLSVFVVNPGPPILQLTLDWTQDAETLIYRRSNRKPVSEVILAP